MGCFKWFFSPATVGHHKRKDKNGIVQQDGFISSILMLVLSISISLAMILTQWLSRERVLFTAIAPFMTECGLILLLVPGFITISIAFYYRNDVTIVRTANVPLRGRSHELVDFIGLYAFGAGSIFFDIFSLISECILLYDCGDKHSERYETTDIILDIVFYLVKPLFTLAQCLFVKKFYRSRFDNKPLLQISLVSIIASNLVIWIYTIIDDDAADLFGKVYQPVSHKPHEPSDLACLRKHEHLLYQMEQYRHYFSPFTLEFSLLIFEKIIKIWQSMTDLDLLATISRDRATEEFHTNSELFLMEHRLRDSHHTHKYHRHSLASSRSRMREWIIHLYDKICIINDPHIIAQTRECLGYSHILKQTIECLDDTIDKECMLLKHLSELQRLNEFNDALANRYPNRSAEVNQMIFSHVNRVTEHRRQLQQVVDATSDHVDRIQIMITDKVFEIERVRQALPESENCRNACGLCCNIGMLAGIVWLGLGIAILAAQLTSTGIASDDVTTCQNRTYDPDMNEFLILSYTIATYRTFYCVILIILGYVGFNEIPKFQSNHTRYNFTDIFYSLSCIGLQILLAFSFLASIQTTDQTVVSTWYANHTNENSTRIQILHQHLKYPCELVNFSTMVTIRTCFESFEVFLITAFILAIGKMLPKGVMQGNAVIREILQFVGVSHFFFWIVHSFVYSPNLAQFYGVELFFYGNTFEVMARITFPLLIFYHFATALRCYDLYSKFSAMP